MVLIGVLAAFAGSQIQRFWPTGLLFILFFSVGLWMLGVLLASNDPIISDHDAWLSASLQPSAIAVNLGIKVIVTSVWFFAGWLVGRLFRRKAVNPDEKK
jgi:hypothetical protein